MRERARDRPGGKSFYTICPQPDGTADVYLRPEPGAYNAQAFVVRGVIPWEGLEDDIRMRYEAWRESGEAIPL